jgi:hypothetical protein
MKSLQLAAKPMASATASRHTVGGGEVMQQRVYHNGLVDADLATALEKLAALPGNLAQQLLDELAGRLEVSTLIVRCWPTCTAWYRESAPAASRLRLPC